MGVKMGQNGFFVVSSKTVQPIWFHLLVKQDVIILHTCAKFRVQAIFCSRDIGSNGGQNWSNGFFVVFSKTVIPTWFHLLVKEDIIILHIRAKFRVQAIFHSRDRGSNGVQNGSKVGFS